MFHQLKFSNLQSNRNSNTNAEFTAKLLIPPSQKCIYSTLNYEGYAYFNVNPKKMQQLHTRNKCTFHAEQNHFRINLYKCQGEINLVCERRETQKFVLIRFLQLQTPKKSV